MPCLPRMHAGRRTQASFRASHEMQHGLDLPSTCLPCASRAAAAAEDGLALCKKLRLPADHELVAGFEAMQGELQQLLKDGGGDEEDAAVEEAS